MEFLVKFGPKETESIAIVTKIQLERLIINLCDSMAYFARESSIGFILEISDKLMKELYESLSNKSNTPENNPSQIIATFLREFFQSRGLDRYAEIRFVSHIPDENATKDLLPSSD